jgi:uncharacterized repeat protein (TIGR03803 family)
MSCNSRLETRGVALLVITTVILAVAQGSWAQSNYKTLHRFSRAGERGARPAAGLVFDQAGNLYGTTPSGGANNEGVVFKLTPNADGGWTEVVLHSFTGGKDGSTPVAALIFDQTGNLYGTTGGGGAYSGGTVFKLMPKWDGSWNLRVLHNFNRYDGQGPNGNLTLDSAGNLFGTTNQGGAYSNGTVFELTPNPDGSWKESVLHSFRVIYGGKDGGYPFGGVTFDLAGNLFGTTSQGGVYSSGTVFELTPKSDGSWKESIIHTFINDGHDGYVLLAAVIFDAAGNLYGTTSGGGGGTACGQFGCGLVFRLTPTGHGIWKESVLHYFTGGNDGSRPSASLTFDSVGNLYSTTENDGAYGYGTIFKLKPNGKGGWGHAVLHSFRNHPGALPISGLISDGRGRLYGTTQGDGQTTFGSIFGIFPY